MVVLLGQIEKLMVSDSFRQDIRADGRSALLPSEQGTKRPLDSEEVSSEPLSDEAAGSVVAEGVHGTGPRSPEEASISRVLTGFESVRGIGAPGRAGIIAGLQRVVANDDALAGHAVLALQAGPAGSSTAID